MYLLILRKILLYGVIVGCGPDLDTLRQVAESVSVSSITSTTTSSPIDTHALIHRFDQLNEFNLLKSNVLSLCQPQPQQCDKIK